MNIIITDLENALEDYNNQLQQAKERISNYAHNIFENNLER